MPKLRLVFAASTLALVPIVVNCSDDPDAPASTAVDGGGDGSIAPGTDARPPADAGSDAADATTPTFAITLGATSYEVIHGSNLDIPLTLQRPPDAQAVTITVTGLSTGVTAEPLVVPAGSATGTLVLKTTATTPTLGSTIRLDAFDGTEHGEVTFALQVRGLAGEPDDSFGPAGVATPAVAGLSFVTAAGIGGGKVTVLAAAPHGEYANPVVLRLDDRGVLDPSFATSGIARFEGDGGTDLTAASLVVNADGTALVGGGFYTDTTTAPLLWRLDATGAVVATYKGSAALDATGLRRITALSTAPNGGTMVAGISANYGASFVARVTGNGELDTTFGAGTGVIALTPASGSHSVHDVTSYPTGAILIAAGAPTPNAGEIERRVVDGEIDPTWGDAGVVDIAGSSLVLSAVTLVDGGVVAAGVALNGGFVPVVDWFSTAGAPLGAFDAGSLSGTSATRVAVGPDGKLLVLLASQTGVGVLRFSAPGTLDPTFGDHGIRTLGGASPEVGAIAVQPDGRLLLAGTTAGPNDTRVLFVARLWL